MGGQVLELKADKWWAEMQEVEKYAREMEKRAEEQEQIISLLERLAEDGRTDDIIRAAKDPVFRQELITEYRCS